jgi:hypothetical protein
LRLDAQYNPAWLNLGLIYVRLGDEAQAFMLVLYEADAYNNIGYI